MARMAIVGSRGYSRLDLVAEFVGTLPPHTVVVSGGARGVDSAAASAARARGLEVVEMKPDWNRYGRSAGFLRNRLIVEDADTLVAFWDGVSRGTAHSIALAQKRGMPVFIFGPDGKPRQ